MVPVALTIAGSDPSGGAGIQADLKTFHQFGVYGMAVITLVTVQNTRGVSRVRVIEPELVLEQVNAVVSDIPPAAVKTGALGDSEIVQVIADWASNNPLPLVVDPVMVSKHGAPLISNEAQETLVRKLIPRAYLLTPNIPEAEVITGLKIANETDMCRAATSIMNSGCHAVLVKGGHSDGQPIDVLLDQSGVMRLPGKRVKTAHTHGTGCTLSAAITALLAQGVDLRNAVHEAKSFVQRAIETAPGLGHGQGPVNHFAR